MEDVGSRHVFTLTRVLAHLEAQTEILLGRREKLILPVVGNQFGCFLLVKPVALALVYGVNRLGIKLVVVDACRDIYRGSEFHTDETSSPAHTQAYCI